MALACLILGYKEPKVLARVVELYKSAGFDIFVHVDAKKELASYTDAMADAANECVFVENRISVYWAGYSMIRATIELIDRARSKRSYSHYLLLSDDTVPLAPPEFLSDNLMRNVNRISMRKLSVDENFSKRYREFYYFDDMAMSLHGRPIENSFVEKSLIATLLRLEKRREMKKADLPIFYGSQWWCLTSETVDAIMKTHLEEEGLRESFEFSAVPDEIYFQTLVANFVPPDKVPAVNSPVYVEWSKDPKPFVYSTVDQIPALDLSQQMFLRKVQSKNGVFLDQIIRTYY